MKLYKRILRNIAVLLVVYFSLNIIPYVLSYLIDILISIRIGGYDKHSFWSNFNGILSHFIAGITCVVATQKLLPSENRAMIIFELLFGLTLIITYRVTPIEKILPQIVPFYKLVSWYGGLLPAIGLIKPKTR